MAKSRSSEHSEWEMVGNGPAISRLRLQIQRIAPHFRTALITGEPGTGKELVARGLHRLSPAAAGPFVVYPCKGTGTDLDHSVRMADGGTLFLDRISNATPEDQAKLLGVLRRQDTPRLLNVRIIASTCEDLKVQTLSGRLSQQLQQRLTTVEIAVPPLRARPEDLRELVTCLLRRGAAIHRVSGDAIKLLEAHSWPGNVTELETVLHQAAMRSGGGVIEAWHLPDLIKTQREALLVDEPMRLQDVMEQHVLRVLKVCAGNKLRTAEMLGVSRSTLYRMLDGRTPHA